MTDTLVEKNNIFSVMFFFLVHVPLIYMVKVEFMMKLATRGQYKYFDLTFQVVCGLRGS